MRLVLRIVAVLQAGTHQVMRVEAVAEYTVAVGVRTDPEAVIGGCLSSVDHRGYASVSVQHGLASISSSVLVMMVVESCQGRRVCGRR